MENNETRRCLHTLAREAKHDRHALDRLLRHPELKHVIYKIANQMVGADEAEDVHQEVRFSISKSIKGWREKASITSWTGQITKNQCVQVLRKKAQERDILIHLSDQKESRQFEDASQLTVAMLRDHLLHILTDLGERCQKMLSLYYQQGLEKKEIMEEVTLGKSQFYEAWKNCEEAFMQKMTHFLRASRKI